MGLGVLCRIVEKIGESLGGRGVWLGIFWERENGGIQLFSPWAHDFLAPPKKIGEKMGMRGEWMEVTHLPYHHP